MTPPSEAIPESPPHRKIAGSVVRVLISTTVVVGAYFALPLDRLNAASSAATLFVAVGLFTLLAVIEVRTIVAARFPGLRALEALGVLIPLLLVIFATGYYLIGIDDPASFSESMSRLDAMYFTLTTFATVGFGDITPVSPQARAVTSTQMVVNLLVLGIGVRVIVGAVNYGRRREHLPVG